MDSIQELEDSIKPFITHIGNKHPLVAEKLDKAFYQLKNAKSIEEYQQTGILLRDAWIEFAQKIFIKDFVPAGIEQPSTTDVKKMLEYTLNSFNNCPHKLLDISKALYNLSNEIQHDTNVDAISPKWGILVTVYNMSLILELDSQNNKLAERRYYKCPQCGSLNLKYYKDMEVDIDGPGAEYEVWSCESCDWEHFRYLV